MADDNGPLTFDALSEMYRVQKNSPTLSPIRKDFYTAAQELLAAQSKECDRLLRENPTSIMYDGAIAKKRKISNTIKDIVRMRMERIAGMATRGAMGANNVIDHLTPEEKEYYNKVLEASKVFWALSEMKKKTMVSQDITEIVKPAPAEVPAVKEEPVEEKPAEVPIPVPEEKKAVLEDVPLSEIPMDDSPEEMPAPVEETLDDDESGEVIGEVPVEIPAEIPEEIPEEIPAEVPAQIAEEVPEEVPVEQPEEVPPVVTEEPIDEGNITIRILEDLPPFSGPEFNYVLKKEDIVRMPAIMANALVNRGVARIVPTA